MSSTSPQALARRLLDQARSLFERAEVRRPVFVVGCQRSGQAMVVDVLRRDPSCRAYHEDNAEAFENHRLRPPEELLNLIRLGPELVTVFDPLLDSQHTDQLVELHPEARAIWMYRHYASVVRSSVRNWGDAHRLIILDVARGTVTRPDSAPVSEAVTDRARAVLDRFVDDDLTDQEGALLHWYVRNDLLSTFAHQDRILLARYRDLVLAPAFHFVRLFAWAGVPFRRSYVEDIHSRSVYPPRLDSVRPELIRLGNAMLGRLHERYLNQMVPEAR